MTIALDGGRQLHVEVEQRDDNVWDRTVRAQDAAPAAGRTLQETLAPLRPAMEAVVGELRAGVAPPDRISVEFGIRFSADAGVILARTATEADLTVAVEWNRPADSPAGR
ncbi:CU044_2847 family protein [Streptomyces sp. NPDC017673]|uniref:CU044_2847 family protein n=1 Tax=unclassified Streptomyces TaxID=2593676 RepID=UPI0037955390